MKAILLLSTIGAAAAKGGWFLGGCSTPITSNDFDITRLQGVWYEQLREKAITPDNPIIACSQTSYYVNDDGVTVTVNNT